MSGEKICEMILSDETPKNLRDFKKFLKTSGVNVNRNVCKTSVFPIPGSMSPMKFALINRHFKYAHAILQSKDYDPNEKFLKSGEVTSFLYLTTIGNFSNFNDSDVKALKLARSFIKCRKFDPARVDPFFKVSLTRVLFTKDMIWWPQDRIRNSLFKLLLECKKIDLNAMEKGETILHRARDPDVVKFLLKAGANPNIKDKNGRLPIAYFPDDKKRIAILKKVTSGPLPLKISKNLVYPLAKKFIGNGTTIRDYVSNEKYDLKKRVPKLGLIFNNRNKPVGFTRFAEFTKNIQSYINFGPGNGSTNKWKNGYTFFHIPKKVLV